MAVSNLFSVSVTSGSALAQACSALSAGQSATFAAAGASSGSYGPPAMLADDLAWAPTAYYGPGGASGRVYIWGKQANVPNGWDFAYYDIATDAWTTVWSNQALGLSGHVFGANGANPDTGDQYIHGGEEDPAARVAYRYNASTGTISASSEGPFRAATIDSSYDIGNEFHPNLYGSGDGAFIIHTKRRLLAWRVSTNTWSTLLDHGLLDNSVATGGKGIYLPGPDAVFTYHHTNSPGYKIAPGPTVTAINPNGLPFNVASVSATGARATCLIKHPSSDSRLWLLDSNQNGGSSGVYEATNGLPPWTSTGYTHPFTVGASQGYILISLPSPFNCIWQISKVHSLLWKPNT